MVGSSLLYAVYPVAIPQSFIDDLLERVDIVDVVGRYVTLKKGGINLLGLCPFHDEKSPSFTVSPSKQFYHCFGCGKNGNALRFLMDYTNVGFIDAVQDLAQRTGMQVPQEDISPAQKALRAQQKEVRLTLTELNAKAAHAYKAHLRQSPGTIQYLKNRGVSGEIAAQYGLGYAPQGEHALASVFPDYADAKLEECGLVIFKEETHRRYDRFRDRLMFPIRNIQGEIIGFGGRILGEGQPKYLNSPETPIFHKGRELYGLFEGKAAIRKAGYALVCEGYMDVIALAQWGFAQSVATLGTACGESHVQLLFRHTDRIIFSFDGDNAGRKAAQKALDCALPFITDTRSIGFLFLPKEHDPDSFIRDRGPQAFAEQVTCATPMSQYLLEVARQDCDLSTPEGRARMTHAAKPLWERLPAGALKIQVLEEIARQAQMASPSLQQLWQMQNDQKPHKASAPSASAPPYGQGASHSPSGPALGAHHGANSGHDHAYPQAIPESDFGWSDAPPEIDFDAHGLMPFESGHAQPPSNWDAPTSHSYAPANGQNRSWGESGQGRNDSYKNWQKRKNEPPAQPPNRQRPISRDEQAVCILLAHMHIIESRSEREMLILRKLAPPAGALFGWLEDQHMHHGLQTWPQLQQSLASSAFAASIARLEKRIEFNADTNIKDATLELESALQGIMLDQIKVQIQALEQHYDSSPEAREKLQELLKQRAELDRIRTSAAANRS